jgi:hypothetical protein
MDGGLDFPAGRVYRSFMAGRRDLTLVFISLALASLAALSGDLPSAWSQPAQTATGQKPAGPALEPLLAKAAEYCRRLESSAFDFVCREEITEVLDPDLDAASRRPLNAPSGTIIVASPSGVTATAYSGPAVVVRWAKKIKRRFVYDYQCVRAGRAIREIRTQLEENGKRKVVPNAELHTSVVVFGTPLLGPVGLFGERFQPSYDFTIAGRDRIGPTDVVVIDAKPKPGAPATRNLYGRAWVDPATGDILKIEWSENRVGRHEIFEKRGEIFKRKPRLVIRSEFSAEKNGIRFPSRLYIEEAYLKESGKAFIRSKTDVVYKDFKFFTVEYDSRD